MTKRKHTRRRGTFTIEILAAFSMTAVVLVPLVGGFTTGVRQTQSVKSYVSAQAIGTWTIAQAKSMVAAGMAYEEEKLDLTASVEQELPEAATQLRKIRVLRTVRRLGTTGRCFAVGVLIQWTDPSMRRPRVLRLQTITRAEV